MPTNSSPAPHLSPISLRSNQVVTLAPNVELVAKRGAFRSKDARMIVAHGVQNVGLEGGPGSVMPAKGGLLSVFFWLAKADQQPYTP